MTPRAPAAMGAWSPVFARPRWLAFGLLVAALAGAASADPPALAPLLKTLDLRGYPSRTAPPQFSGRTLGARQLSMTEHRGRVILLNFWASWCLECRSEMPGLERLHREFSSRGLVIIGVNARESKKAVGRYATELGLTYQLVFDPDGKINALYGVIGFPTTFVVGRDGRAVAFAIGPRQWESAPARALIEALLAEPVPGTAVR
ncbi:MAG: TlpA family protein disulfide reductase [candidate division NC10 bacterium]|nr:TlpA family protein disulfide reductase [candidate division NC10 bacterium]